MKSRTRREKKDPGDRVEITLEIGLSDGRAMTHQEAARFEKELRRLAPEIYPGMNVRACWVAKAPLFLGHGEPPRLAHDAFERESWDG